MVSVIEVSAAGSRGSETAISSQPSTCEVSASSSSQPWAGQAGTRSTSPIARPGDGGSRGGDHRGVEQRAGGPAQVGAALAQHEDEARVRESR